MLTDTHAHLDHERFEEDREDMIRRAVAAGVSRMVTIGTDPDSCRRALALAEQFESVYAAVGLHPTDALRYDDDVIAGLVAMSTHEKVVAIGEIGLDYYWKDVPPDTQQFVFRKLIDLACTRDLPIIIHVRDAHEDLIRVLHEEKERHGMPVLEGIMHCFSGDERFLRASLDLGFHISFAGNLTYQKSTLPLLAARVPSNRLLVETDAPYLPPVPHRGRRNEPAFVRHTAEKLAEIRSMSLEDLARMTTANAARLFRWS